MAKEWIAWHSKNLLIGGWIGEMNEQMNGSIPNQYKNQVSYKVMQQT